VTEKKAPVAKTTQAAPGAAPSPAVEASPAEHELSPDPVDVDVAGNTTSVVLAHPWVDPATGVQHWPRQTVEVDADTARSLRGAGLVATGPPADG
jgi:hypothetical protein